MSIEQATKPRDGIARHRKCHAEGQTKHVIPEVSARAEASNESPQQRENGVDRRCMPVFATMHWDTTREGHLDLADQSCHADVIKASLKATADITAEMNQDSLSAASHNLANEQERIPCGPRVAAPVVKMATAVLDWVPLHHMPVEPT